MPSDRADTSSFCKHSLFPEYKYRVILTSTSVRRQPLEMGAYGVSGRANWPDAERLRWSR